MAELYVATDPEGRERRVSSSLVWPLPHLVGSTMTPGERLDAEAVLCEPIGLLGRLDERIWRADSPKGFDATVAAAYAHGDQPGDELGRHHVRGARIVAPTGWDGFVAASFAIDCAEHVLGNAAGVALPDGTKLGDALEQVRAWLQSAEETGGKLHDLAIGRRLRREGRAIGEAAAVLQAEDARSHVAALDDAVWTTLEAARDAVLAAVEAVQHAVLPRLREREAHHYEESARAHEPETGGGQLSFVPAWIAADDSAELARRAAADANGQQAAATELQWQADHLAALLTS
jgi:hypothetical protein